MLTPLPIDPHLPRIADALAEHRAVMVTAPPGSGKTTRVPPSLIDAGRVICLQPRRVAARSLARRIADERGWTAGREVGWQVRDERRFTDATRLVVATEGILTARLLADPLLDGVATVVLDEFHERSVHADLALAFARQAWRARGDLRIVVMSATLDVAPVAAFLDDCPTVDAPGRPHPVEIAYRPHVDVVDAAAEAAEARAAAGHVLVFLPGAGEIERAATALRARLGDRRDVRPLYGALPAREQDAALAPSARPKLILATNIAETSLTIEGVTHVVDSGLHRVLRHDPGSGLDRLEVERIPRDAADQRAGRAGRTAPGVAWRLWDERDELRDRREPELGRIDLAGPVLDVCAWGDDPRTFAWFEPPPADAIDRALELLRRLGAIEGVRITDVGRRMRRLPMHPRLARMALAGGSEAIARAAVALADGWRPRTEPGRADSDLLVLVDRFDRAPAALRRAAARVARDVRRADGEPFLRAVLRAYPDRVARRRTPDAPRYVLANGEGATLDRESHVAAEWIVAVDSIATARGRADAIRIRHASAIEPGWLTPDRTEREASYDAARGIVRGVEREYYGALVLAERDAEVDDATATDLLLEAWRAREPTDADVRLLHRLRFAGIDVDLEAELRTRLLGERRLPGSTYADLLPWDASRKLGRLAPERWRLPSGNHARIDYREDGSIGAGAKLQELFGLTRTPTFGPRKTPLTIELRAPNGRAVQTTQDLASFWATGYAEVRKELRGRYPKHPWPEDPLAAEPTARTKRRG